MEEEKRLLYKLSSSPMAGCNIAVNIFLTSLVRCFNQVFIEV